MSQVGKAGKQGDRCKYKQVNKIREGDNQFTTWNAEEPPRAPESQCKPTCKQVKQAGKRVQSSVR